MNGMLIIRPFFLKVDLSLTLDVENLWMSLHFDELKYMIVSRYLLLMSSGG